MTKKRSKPISLHGLKFTDAVAGMLQVKPPKKKSPKKKQPKKA